MLINMLKSKIHRASVTESNLNYVGSITIDSILMEMTDINIGEKVDVVNINNGARFSTYTMEADPHSGIICLNGAAARLVENGDKIIIISYCWLPESEVKQHQPKIVIVDDNNKRIQ